MRLPRWHGWPSTSIEEGTDGKCALIKQFVASQIDVQLESALHNFCYCYGCRLTLFQVPPTFNLRSLERGPGALQSHFSKQLLLRGRRWLTEWHHVMIHVMVAVLQQTKRPLGEIKQPTGLLRLTWFEGTNFYYSRNLLFHKLFSQTWADQMFLSCLEDWILELRGK